MKEKDFEISEKNKSGKGALICRVSDAHLWLFFSNSWFLVLINDDILSV